MPETPEGTRAVGSSRIGQKAERIGGAAPHVRLLSRLRAEQVGPPDCPIMFRWTLLGSSGSSHRLMLHWFPPNADDRDVHDHPCDFSTLVLAGGYDDLVPYDSGPWRSRARPAQRQYAGMHGLVLTEAGDFLRIGDRMRRGSFRFRSAEHQHRTRAGSGGCWSLVWMRPARRRWGFMRRGKWFEWRDYERLFGFGMRCDPSLVDDGWKPAIEDPRRSVPPRHTYGDLPT